MLLTEEQDFDNLHASGKGTVILLSVAGVLVFGLYLKAFLLNI